MPGGSSSASSTSYCGGENTGSLSFTSWTTTATEAVAERGGLPPSVAVTWIGGRRFFYLVFHVNLRVFTRLCEKWIKALFSVKIKELNVKKAKKLKRRFGYALR